MATCMKCGSGRMRKKRDGWFHCKRHGRVRRVGPSEYRMETNQSQEKEREPTSSNDR